MGAQLENRSPMQYNNVAAQPGSGVGHAPGAALPPAALQSGASGMPAPAFLPYYSIGPGDVSMKNAAKQAKLSFLTE